MHPKFIYFTTSLFFIFTIESYSQTNTFSGDITNTKGEGLGQISVVLKNAADSSMLAYTFSDDAGHYSVACSGNEKEILITVSGISIASQTKKIRNATQTVNFIVKEESFQLKEVIVKAKPITFRKDTIDYLVSAFSTEKDFVIGDVLKKMPGIDVSSSGRILYQGKPINKFYIENLDMLGGRYGIATQNIPVKDVSTVQVLENHQPVKAMDSLRFSDHAAINLKLKDGAKGTFSVMAQLGIGAKPLLWNNELTGMFFSEKKQHISTYKTNNTGNDLSRELRSFTSDFYLEPDKVTNIQMPSPPNIRLERYLFNSSHAVTINNLFKPKGDNELSLNIIYYNDYEKRQSNESSAYYLAKDSLLRIGEDIRSFENTDHVEAEVKYNENKDTYYLNNSFGFEGDWESGKGDINNGMEINQRLYRPSIKAQNHLWIIKPNGKLGFELNSRTGFTSAPQYLRITPGLYDELFNEGKSYWLLNQEVKANTFVSGNHLVFISPVLIKGISINPSAGFNVEINRLVSDLYPSDNEKKPLYAISDSMRNDLLKTKLSADMGLHVNFKIGRIKINSILPVYYHFYSLQNQIDRTEKSLNKINFEPNVNVEYKPNHNFDMNASYSSFNRVSGLYELFNGYILMSYRNINRFEGLFAEMTGNRYSLDISYKDILKILFLSGKISYNSIRNSVMTVQNFNGNLLETSFVEKPNDNNALSFSGKISKGFDFMKITSNLEISRRMTNYALIRQNNIVNGKNFITNVSFGLNIVPVSFIILSYKGEWQQSHTKFESSTSYPSIQSVANSANADFTLIKNVSIGAKYEQYCNSAVESNKTMYFGDINLAYSLKQTRFSLEWNNIFDTRYYTRAFYSDINEYHYNYAIRPSQVVLKVKFKLK